MREKGRISYKKDIVLVGRSVLITPTQAQRLGASGVLLWRLYGGCLQKGSSSLPG